MMVFPHKEPVEVEAAQYLENYDPYTYNGSYYDSIDFDAEGGMNGELRQSLTSLIIPKGFYTYTGLGETHLSTQLQYADEDPTNSDNMVYFYTRNSVPKTEATVDGTTIWTREHVWCQSLSSGNWGTSEGGTDLLHLRPAYKSTNSSRNNSPYGDVKKAEPKYYQGMLYGYLKDDTFEPIDSVKGDVARVIMYLWTTYTGYKNYTPLNILSVFQSYDLLLKWHTMDKPDVLEGNRNNYVQSSKQKNRNPYVDHPELAWKIFGDTVSASVKNACMEAYPADSGGETPVEATGIRLNKSEAELLPTNTLQLKATLEPINAVGSISWSSSNNSIASVDNNGLVTANAVGNATITATVGSYSAYCNINVINTINYGSLENPLSISEATEVINITGTSSTAQQLYVRGIVSSNTAFNQTYNNYDAVWLESDDGTINQAFELYRVRFPSLTDEYKGADTLKGYEVVAYGYGKLYHSTPELAPVSSNYPSIFSIRSTAVSAKEVIETSVTTQSSLTYRYVLESKKNAVDTLNRAFTGRTGTQYGDWNNTTTNGVSYAGQSAAGNNAIQLRSNNSNSGIVVTNNGSGLSVSKITLTWNTNTESARKVDIYGRTTPFTAPTELYNTSDPKIGNMAYSDKDENTNKTSITIDGDYTYIGLRSNSGALYLDSIEIIWGEQSKTYTYSNVGIRYTGVINQSLWDRLDNESNIEGYGILFSTSLHIGDEELKELYASADQVNIKKYYTELDENKLHPALVDDNYVWSLFKNIPATVEGLTELYVAVAFIKTQNDIVFMNQVEASVKTLADSLIKSGAYDEDFLDGSMYNLAHIN